MQQLNNLDVIILIITAVSALIALCRGLVKEVLSIVGWVLAAVAVFYLLPVLTPLAKIYIASQLMAGLVTALVVLVVFYIVWLFSTDHMISKIRASKLSALDRVLGLLFGVLRACLLVILFNILVTWALPEEAKSGMFKESRYFTLAGRFAEPFESLIPQSTIDLFKRKSSIADKSAEEDKETEEDGKKEEDGQEEKNDKATAADILFEKLAQPAVEKVLAPGESSESKDFEGYRENETDNLDRLIENTVE